MTSIAHPTMERNNMRARFTVGQDLHGNLKEFMDNGDGTWSDLYNEVIVPEQVVFARYPWIPAEIKAIENEVYGEP